ncbi:uncharacterized protein TrAtP1_008261 [Trichoderma atroviride]|uniref:uncharacterized protein n=1 Tax=Hypocrea atroviridis TaxID=63577 RepID=UPI00331F21BB|nr:hypothetical protein TrAtP1_008261 [Trichoderma atroviride]
MSVTGPLAGITKASLHAITTLLHALDPPISNRIVATAAPPREIPGLSPYFAMSLSLSEPWHLGTCTARKQTHTPLPPGGLMAMTSCTLLYEAFGKVPLAASHPNASPSTRSTSRLRDIHAS